MGQTMSEKILARAAGRKNVKPGEILWVNVDRAMMDDILGPRVEIAKHMKEIKDEVWDKEKVVIISDHYTPPASIKQAEIVKFTRDWAKEHGIGNYFEFVGPCHQIMAEHGFVRPGTVIVGTDSHTCMGGAMGAFATGIGSTEMMGVLIKGQIWMRVPETIRVVWDGSLPSGVMAKDISLKTIGVIGHAGATYKTVEYVGTAVSELPVDERMAITNMAVEMGAKAGLMEPDEKVREFLEAHGGTEGITEEDWSLRSDEDAIFCQNPVVGILQQLVGVHPENIRHLVAGGCSLQLGPVFVPAGDLHLNVDLRVLLGVGRTHSLHALLLCNVPDLEGQCLLAAGRTAAAVAAAGCQHGCGAHCRHCLYELSARDLHFCSPPKSLFRRVIFVWCCTGRVDFSCFCQLLQKQRENFVHHHIAQFLFSCCAIIILSASEFVNAKMRLVISQFE